MNEELEARKLELEIRALELDVESGERMASKVLAEGTEVGQFTYVGAIHEAAVHSMIQKLESWSRRYPGAALELHLNSGGGNVVDGFAMIDYLEILKRRGHKVTIVGFGMVASMAGAILMAADERVLTKHCYLGVHEVSSRVEGSLSIQEDGIKFAKALQEQVVTLLCDRSTLTPRKLANMWARKDVYLNAAESLKLGLIDRIEA